MLHNLLHFSNCKLSKENTCQHLFYAFILLFSSETIHLTQIIACANWECQPPDSDQQTVIKSVKSSKNLNLYLQLT